MVNNQKYALHLRRLIALASSLLRRCFVDDDRCVNVQVVSPKP
jgi:hypothetical protein